MGVSALIITAAGLFLGADAADNEEFDKVAKRMAKEVRRLQGTYVVVSMEYHGKKVPRSYYQNRRMTFAPAEGGLWGKVTTTKGKQTLAGSYYAVNPAKQPWRLYRISTRTPPNKKMIRNLSDRGKMLHGIYKLQGKTLTICAPDKEGVKPPTKFATSADSDHILVVLRRVES
jgi:uncharacterized protein (TIGR03067 family)